VRLIDAAFEFPGGRVAQPLNFRVALDENEGAVKA